MRFKEVLQNIDNNTTFLYTMIDRYQFIMNKCAPAVSKHFTNLTSVINEGNSYEFPSADIHKAIINKLILHDQQHLR